MANSSEGAFYERKADLRRAVRSRVRICAAREERKRIQQREKLFRRGASNRFRLPQQRWDICSKLMRDGKIVTEKIEMLEMWAAHFERLACSDKDGLEGLWKEVEEMNRESRQNEDVILDVAFTAEEVVKKKASGPDGLMAEHLQEAGTEVQIWLRNVLNAIVDFEEIPS